MLKPEKPPPIFEVVFIGEELYPEVIPLGALTSTLSAIRRLASGIEPVDEDEEEEKDDGSIRLVDVERGSAVFQFVGQYPLAAIMRLREAGKVLVNPEAVGEHDYMLRPSSCSALSPVAWGVLSS